MLETLPHIVGHTERANAYLAEEMGSRVSQDRALQSCGCGARIHRRVYEHASEVVSGDSHLNTLALMSTPRDEHNTISMRNRTFTIRR
jgi:hypothetical protein